jgi:hypothetical protein
MDSLATRAVGARLRRGGTPPALRIGPRYPAKGGSPSRLALGLALAIVLGGCAAGTAQTPLAVHPAPTDPGPLLHEVRAHLLAARHAEVAFMVRYPVEGVAGARHHVTDAHAAVRRARVAAARLGALDTGTPDNCCNELEYQLARYDARLKDLEALADLRGDPNSGLRWEAHRTLDGLDRYLVRLEEAEDVGAPPTPRADAIQILRDDVTAIRRDEADYHRLDDIQRIASIGDRVVTQRAFLANSPLEDRERARVDTHVRLYLIYLERVAVTDVGIYRVRRSLYRTAERVQYLVRYYLTGEGAATPGGRIV